METEKIWVSLIEKLRKNATTPAQIRIKTYHRLLAKKRIIYHRIFSTLLIAIDQKALIGVTYRGILPTKSDGRFLGQFHVS